MRARTGLVFLACILVLGCQREPGPTANLHDTKYSDVKQGEDASGHCVLDQFTGLMWEVKSDEPGLHDWRNTYSWFDPEESHDELDYRGTPSGGECAGSDCDSWSFVGAVNAAGYCGFNDWRIPSRDELQSIIDPRKADTPPTTNMDYFPFAQAAEYWSSNDYSFQYDAAWAWSFMHGLDRVDWKRTPKFVRLVRGEAEQLIPDRE